MASYTVTKVRKEYSTDRTHRHLEGVFTSSGTHYTRAEVAASINAGSDWKTLASDGSSATIKVESYCPKSGCLAKPYIKTNPDSTKLDNLENLPEA